MRRIFLASEEPDEWPALLCDVIANGPLQHRIARLKRIQDRALGGRSFHFRLTSPLLRDSVRKCAGKS